MIGPLLGWAMALAMFGVLIWLLADLWNDDDDAGYGT